jgi:hypothetical protein
LWALVARQVQPPKLAESADHGGLKEDSATKAIRIARLTWGVEFDALFIFASTTLTLLGVDLFARWSILSNVTTYVVILLHPSFRRGTFVCVFDTDNYVGVIFWSYRCSTQSL